VRAGIIVGGAITVFLLMLALLLLWQFHRTSLTTAELQSNLKPVRPSPEPIAVEEDYSTHRAKTCTKAEPVVDITICDILKAPQTFASQCVRVKGRFLTDGLEHSIIVDESCKEALSRGQQVRKRRGWIGSFGRLLALEHLIGGLRHNLPDG